VSQRAILAIDQGTSSTKAVVVGEHGEVLAKGTAPLGQSFPRLGWVEQSPDELWDSVLGAIRGALGAVPGIDVELIALSTQRESVVCWSAETRAPVTPLVSWQDRRAAELCEAVAAGAAGGLVPARTGLPVDPMFSAGKLSWLLRHDDGVREARARDLLRVGTVDSWLLYKLTGGRLHAVEVGNAARTQLLRLDTACWDPDLLEAFAVPAAILPEIRPSTGPFGTTRGVPGLPDGVPIAAVLGDSHAALFGHGGARAGVVKATYGTGTSLMGIVEGLVGLPSGLSRTIGWQLPGESPAIALEANIASTGAAVTWVAELLGVDTIGLAALAREAQDSEVVLVPAFNGLGAPYWDRNAQALLVGMTLASGRAEIAAAVLDSVALQVADTFTLFLGAADGRVVELQADGGASTNDQLMQFQADLVQLRVIRASRPEVGCLGVAQLAGLSDGWWTAAELESSWSDGQVFAPVRDPAWSAGRLRTWHEALARARLVPALV
jgi:glycerol kinase